MSGSLLAMFLYLRCTCRTTSATRPWRRQAAYLPITLLAFLVGPIAGTLLSRVPARLLLSVGLGMTESACC